MKKEELPIYRVTINEHDDETGVHLVSLVDRPAMQVQAITLSDHNAAVEIKLETQKEEKTMTAPVIIPNKLIYRNKPTERQIYFEAEDIVLMRNKFMLKSGNLRLSNKNHVQDDIVDAYLVETWIITEENKSWTEKLGFDLPKGTWMATYKIGDTKFWDEEIKTGNITGFSLEGMFEEIETQLAAQGLALADDYLNDPEINQLMGEVLLFIIEKYEN